MTEVPEHLLRRSKERREALGLGGDEGAPTPSDETPAAAAATPPADEAAAVPEPAEPAAAAAAVPAITTPERSPYVEPRPPRRIPGWAYPVLGLLPFWAIVYFGAFGSRAQGPVDPLVLGEQVYTSAGCAGCHGGQGQGVGDFPKLAGGDAKVTFPNLADHIEWIKTGSQSKPKGTPYGDPNRAGGQHVVRLGVMPAFGASLSEEQIQAVAKYEREKL